MIAAGQWCYVAVVYTTVEISDSLFSKLPWDARNFLKRGSSSNLTRFHTMLEERVIFVLCLNWRCCVVFAQASLDLSR
jgi:hypothetical protein